MNLRPDVLSLYKKACTLGSFDFFLLKFNTSDQAQTAT